MEDFQTLHAVQGIRHNAQHLEIAENIRFDTVKLRLGFLDTVRIYAEGNELGFN